MTSITRQTPSSSPTNFTILTWRVTFDEAVQNMNEADFGVSGTTTTISGVSQVGSTNAYDATASGGNLASLNATVTLSFASNHDITDRRPMSIPITPTTRTSGSPHLPMRMAGLPS